MHNRTISSCYTLHNSIQTETILFHEGGPDYLKNFELGEAKQCRVERGRMNTGPGANFNIGREQRLRGYLPNGHRAGLFGSCKYSPKLIILPLYVRVEAELQSKENGSKQKLLIILET
jgi:hypothetical protein